MILNFKNKYKKLIWLIGLVSFIVLIIFCLIMTYQQGVAVPQFDNSFQLFHDSIYDYRKRNGKFPEKLEDLNEIILSNNSGTYVTKFGTIKNPIFRLNEFNVTELIFESFLLKGLELHNGIIPLYEEEPN